MGRLAPGVEEIRRPRMDVGDRTCADRSATVSDPLRREQGFHRDLVELRIAQMLRAIGEAGSHGLDPPVQGALAQTDLESAALLPRRGFAHAGPRVLTLGVEGESVEDGQHLQQQDPTRAGRRHRQELLPAEAPDQRFVPPDSVVRQVLLVHHARMGAHLARDRTCHVAAVEGSSAVGSELAQGQREFGLAQAFTGAQRDPARVEGARGRNAARQAGSERLASQGPGQPGIDFEATFGELDRRRNDVGPVQTPEPTMERLEPCRRSRDAAREVALERERGDRQAVVAHEQIRRQPPGRDLAEVQCERSVDVPVGSPDREAPTPQVACLRIDHSERQGRGDCRVGGVATSVEDRQSDLGRQGVLARNGAAVGRRKLGRQLRRPRSTARQEQREPAQGGQSGHEALGEPSFSHARQPGIHGAHRSPTHRGETVGTSVNGSPSARGRFTRRPGAGPRP